MTVALTAFKEKIRRKEFYIACVLSIVVSLFFCTGTGTLSVNGVEVTDYKALAPIMLIVVNALSCFLTVMMSLGTIPKEYERRTSHLVWIRNVSQSQYHGELALANVMSGIASAAILFLSVLVLMVSNNHAADLWRLIPTFLIVAVNVSAVSLMTSMLSIVLPKFVAGAISAVFAFVGVFHSMLSLLKDIVGGFGGLMIKYALKIIPNLHGIQSEAGNFLCGKSVDIHLILEGLLAVYVFAVLIITLKRKEA